MLITSSGGLWAFENKLSLWSWRANSVDIKYKISAVVFIKDVLIQSLKYLGCSQRILVAFVNS